MERSQSYREHDLATASPLGIVVALFDGAIRSLARARTALATRRRADAAENIARSLAIVHHLSTSLDPAPAPELAERLRVLYSRIARRLVETNLSGDADRLDEAERLLVALRSTWRQLLDGRRSSESA